MTVKKREEMQTSASVDKIIVMQISGDAEEVKLKEVTEEKDIRVDKKL